jgi:hypothetical protein
MAAPPILLVADDLAVIAAVKRVLGREGYECILATSAADAVIGWGHALPGLVLLQPSVESDRGAVVLEELQQHPDAKLLRVVLLGETVPGFPWPVEPLPLDPEHFATTLDENVRTTTASGAWSVLESTSQANLPRVPASTEPEAWRATSPHEPDPVAAASEEVPEPEAVAEPTLVGLAPRATPVTEALEEKLFGDLAADVEASAMQSVESSLQRSEDAELQRLEDDVRAEAQRRRASRQTGAAVRPAPPSPPGPTTELMSEDPTSGETSFEDVGETPPTPPSEAGEVLSRAEQMLLETRARSQARRQVEDSEVRQIQLGAEAALRRAAEAEERARADQAELVTAKEEVRRLTGVLENEQELARVRHENTVEELASKAAVERQSLEGAIRQLQHQLDAETGLRLESERTVAGLEKRLEAMQVEASSTREERDARVSELTARLEQANEALRLEQERHGARTAELQQAQDALRVEQEERREEHARREAVEAALASSRDDAEAAMALASEVEVERQQLAEARSQLELATQHLTEAKEARDVAQDEMLALEESREQLSAQLADAAGQLERARADVTSSSELLEETARERDQLRAQLAGLETARALAEKLGTELTAQTATLERERARWEAELATTKAEASAAEATMDQAHAAERADWEAQRRGMQGQLEELAATLTERENTLQALTSEFEAAKARVDALTHVSTSERTKTEELRAALDAQRSQAEKLEAAAQLAAEKVKELEAREVMPLTLPNQRPMGVARHGSVTLEGLARVVCQLVLGNAEARLELGASGGTRTVWFKRGQIVAAESSFDVETLVSRARRDGLIDGKQEGELRMLRGATPRVQLDALKARGFIRDVESVPLVQRYTEQVALDAFTEEDTLYRILEEAPGPDVLLATVPRPTLPMLAESLRRALSVDLMLEQLGGGEAVPHATDSELDVRALGFSERERKMLTWVDGEATVEDLSLASGLKPDLAFRALLVAKLLGLVEVKPGQKKAEPGSGQLDVNRLEAKFDEVQDADYFTILGLSRAAGSDDVRRAFQRLSQEFDPLRFSGHSDPALQQRAQMVANLLEEAARALEDDRRRVEYARHLLD